MKTLIAYATKSGTTERCAVALSEKIPDSTLVDLRREKPDPAAYDQVIVGGSVRMGTLHVDARQYLDGAKPALLKKKLGVFLCAGSEDGVLKVIENNVDPEIRAHAAGVMSFGGEMIPDKLRGMEKFIVKMALRAGKDDRAAPPSLRPERIEQFAALFREE